MLRATGQTVHRARKQHPAGHLSLDFYCAAAKLCIEVDGEAHNRGDQPEFDPGRDARLRLHGIETMRIPAVEVFRNLDGVVAHIVETARLRLPLHRPAGGPPPRSGEV
jgi:very-short-patch-repair endonuclease